MAAMAGAGLPGAARRGRCRWRQRVQVTMAEVAAAEVAMAEVVPAAGVPVKVAAGVPVKVAARGRRWRGRGRRWRRCLGW